MTTMLKLHNMKRKDVSCVSTSVGCFFVEVADKKQEVYAHCACCAITEVVQQFPLQTYCIYCGYEYAERMQYCPIDGKKRGAIQ